MFRKRLRRAKQVAPELNITAFMNLMVVLVPFLLMTAVFSQINILKIALPGASQGPQNPVENSAKIALEVIFQGDKILLNDRNSGVIKTFSWQQGEGYGNQATLRALNLLLQELKARFPEENNISILSQPDTPYADIVAVMDAVRVAWRDDDQNGYALFPNSALGRAPQVQQAEGGDQS